MGARRNYQAGTPRGKSDVRARGYYERAKAALPVSLIYRDSTTRSRRRSNYDRDNVLRTLSCNS